MAHTSFSFQKMCVHKAYSVEVLLLLRTRPYIFLGLIAGKLVKNVGNTQKKEVITH